MITSTPKNAQRRAGRSRVITSGNAPHQLGLSGAANSVHMPDEQIEAVPTQLERRSHCPGLDYAI
ncbi:hypothetical protein [Pectobacterium peruviense]|uniref:hypothetical protein n=1 Tax=Pectobacterium peruviense TaxID=2066479 RepID=UPI0011AEBA59|nr:hypothetical protein [Pectobacterium peruviense]